MSDLKFDENGNVVLDLEGPSHESLRQMLEPKRDPMADFENGARLIKVQPEQALVIGPETETAVLRAVDVTLATGAAKFMDDLGHHYEAEAVRSVLAEVERLRPRVVVLPGGETAKPEPDMLVLSLRDEIAAEKERSESYRLDAESYKRMYDEINANIGPQLAAEKARAKEAEHILREVTDVFNRYARVDPDKKPGWVGDFVSDLRAALAAGEG